jgi:hypothetical protein
MNKPTPFQVTPEALYVIASLLRLHPGMQPALIMKPSFEFLDDRGSVEARFEFEQFMIAHDTADKFFEWPKVDLCGEAIPVEARALERLNGRTLKLDARQVVIEGEKETLEFLVAA